MSEKNRHLRVLNKILKRRGLWYDPRFMLEHWTEERYIFVHVTGPDTGFLMRYEMKGSRTEVWEIKLRYRLQLLKKLSMEYDTIYIKEWRNNQFLPLLETMSERMGYDDPLPFRLQMIDLFATYNIKIDYDNSSKKGE